MPGEHTLVFTFANPLTSVGGASINSGNGSVSSGAIGSDPHQYVVHLTGVADAQTLTVSLNNVSDSLGNFSTAVSTSMGLLLGDTTGTGDVNSSDIGQTKSQSGSSATGANFRTDVTVNGVINSSDVGVVKSKSGNTLP